MRAPASFILVVGGAGYLGSHMVKLLWHVGHLPTVLDDLSAGRRSASPSLARLGLSLSG